MGRRSGDSWRSRGWARSAGPRAIRSADRCDSGSTSGWGSCGASAEQAAGAERSLEGDRLGVRIEDDDVLVRVGVRPLPEQADRVDGGGGVGDGAGVLGGAAE